MSTPSASASTTSANSLSPSESASCERRALYRWSIERSGRWDLEAANCADSVAHFVDAWCYTYDPRRPDAAVPFDLFPRQAEFLAWLADRERLREDGLCEKSRDTGLTWLCCAYALHGWLFRPGFAAGFGSRKLELVDRLGDMAGIFEKARFLLYGLPAGLRPPSFRRADHDNLARLVNPDTGATLTGEGGDNIGRGDRKSIYFLDEAAFLERPELVERALSQTTNVCVSVSTPNGPGNPFAARRFSGRVPVFTMHWKDDPRKGEDWYAYQRDVKYAHDPVGLAQEVDIDFTASVEGITIPAAWVRAAVGLDLPRGRRVVAGFDVGEEGPDLSVVIARAGPVVLPPVSWGKATTTESAWKAKEALAGLGADEVCYDAGGPGMGIKGTWNAYEGKLPFRACPVLFGGECTDDRWPDGKTSREKFLNLRAEMWWKLRARFERSYEYKHGGVAHALEDCVSIPDHPQLIAELSLPLSERTESGKIKLESKEKMRRRGVKSPDFGDALALCFFSPPLRKLWVGV